MLDRLSNLRENREISSPVLLFVPWYTYSLDAAEGGSYTVAEGRTTGGDGLIVHIVILGNFTAHSNFYKSLEHLWRFSLRLSLG